MGFADWLLLCREADQDYPWAFVHSSHSRKVRDLISPEDYAKWAPLVRQIFE